MDSNERQVAGRVAARDAAGTRVMALTAAVAAVGVIGGSILGVHLGREAAAAPDPSTSGSGASGGQTDSNGSVGYGGAIDDDPSSEDSDGSTTQLPGSGSSGLTVPGPRSAPHATSGGS